MARAACNFGHDLTRREREVVELLVRDYSYCEIAHTLVIAEKTARNHADHILRKLHLHSRTQIASWAVEHGWIFGNISAK